MGLQDGSDGDCIRVKVLVSWGSEWLFLGNEFVDGGRVEEGKRDKDGSRVAPRQKRYIPLRCSFRDVRVKL